MCKSKDEWAQHCKRTSGHNGASQPKGISKYKEVKVGTRTQAGESRHKQTLTIIYDTPTTLYEYAS